MFCSRWNSVSPACGFVLRGRDRQAWAAMALMLAGTTAWALATGGSLLVVGAYNGGHVLTLAIWSLTAMWSERAYRAIGFQQCCLWFLRAQRRAEEEIGRVLMEVWASMARQALPVTIRHYCHDWVLLNTKVLWEMLARCPQFGCSNQGYYAQRN